MRFTNLIKSIWLILFASTTDTFAEENVCKNKYWLQSPIVEAKANDGSGIGGTGFSPPTNSDLLAQRNGEGESGIGGTGIVGIISGFGSICVNGIEIQYDSKTPIVEDGIPTQSNHLALGQTVSILATHESQNYHAQEIHVLHEVQGVVTSIDSSSGVFSVLGQTVHLPETLLTEITIGDNVVVSGNRLTDGSIEATRVEQQHDAMNKVSVIGPLETDNVSGNFHIGKQPIELSVNQTTLKSGDEVRIQGVLKDGVLHAETLEHNPRWSFASRVDQLLLQGYVRQGDGEKINIDGVKITVNDVADKTPKTGEHVSVWVREIEKGKMILDHRQEQHEQHEQHEHSNHLGGSPLLSSPHKLEPVQINHPDVDDKPNLLHPEINRPDIDDKPNLLHPEINRPDIDDKPNLLHPEINRPDIDDKPNLLHPEINRPDIDDKPNLLHPEINRPDIDKTTLLHLEVNHPDIDKPEVSHSKIEHTNIEHLEHINQ
ncbi:MAG: DUF5666 domain-containing protein [Methylococcales bacterium]|nr:DUF5666 domain-containing protein [Methylococcales bacterium]